MFYHYNQNNSGGSFRFDEKEGITHHVIIEAKTETEAEAKAKTIGLYFDGFGDCNCCGNRWSPYPDVAEKPEIYGISPEEYVKDEMTHLWMKPGKEVVVHYQDGKIEWF